MAQSAKFLMGSFDYLEYGIHMVMGAVSVSTVLIVVLVFLCGARNDRTPKNNNKKTAKEIIPEYSSCNALCSDRRYFILIDLLPYFIAKCTCTFSISKQFKYIIRISGKVLYRHSFGQYRSNLHVNILFKSILFINLLCTSVSVYRYLYRRMSSIKKLVFG